MAINFNTLPTERPSGGAIIPKGKYEATIVKSEMKQGKDSTKPPYLNIEMDITDIPSGTNMGKLWAILTESEAPLPRYQLSRFIKALELPITGEFDLKDLTKMINGKKLLVDIVPEDRKDGQDPQRSIVDALSADIFYPITRYPQDATPETPFMEDTPFVEDTPQTMSAY